MLNFIADIGTNHNNDIAALKLLLKFAKGNGFKFAKIDKEINIENLFDGLNIFDYQEAFDYANSIGINIYFSCNDCDSADLLSMYTNICEISVKKSKDSDFIRYIKTKFKYIIISVNNIDLDEITELFYSHDPHLIIYRQEKNSKNKPNLSYIKQIKNKIPRLNIGYNNNIDNISSYVAVTQGINYIERSITLDKNLFGDGHISALEPMEFKKYIKKLRYAKSLL
jgi:sialic acid synthase SpsE